MRRIDPWFAVGLVAFFALLFVALFGERIAPYEPIYFVVEHEGQRRPYAPGEVFALGSDVLGRDLLSLVLAGARATLIIGVVAGLARVLAGLALAVVASWWRPLRSGADSLAEIVSAVPATLVAVLVVLVFIRGDAQVPTFVAALLVTGWAGPYRVARAEIDRLRHGLFTESALALGVRRLPLFARHHLPHLVPVLAVSAAQQSVASLVAVAELGVLGIFVGATKFVNVREAVTAFRGTTDVGALWISEIPEWGGLLANGRGIENLWTTRWVILVPGVAFALAAVALSMVGVGVARQFQRRNALYAVRSRTAASLALLCAVLVVAAAVLPERYAEALEWADDARTQLASAGSIDDAFAESGLRPLGNTFGIERRVASIEQTSPAKVSAAGVEISEDVDKRTNILPVLYHASGGAVLDAPLVYAGWGLSPSDHPPAPARVGTFGTQPGFGTLVQDWADDYATLDVRGKVVITLRMPNVQLSRTTATTTGQDFETTVMNALKRGAAAILYIDPALPTLSTTVTGQPFNPYLRLAGVLPIERPEGVPVIVLSLPAAERLLRPLGVSPAATWNSISAVDTFSGSPGVRGQKLISNDDPITRRSLARDLGVASHVELPVGRLLATPTSFVGVSSDSPRILVWAVLPATRGGSRTTSDALAAFLRSLAARDGAHLAVVAFDRSVDATGNARAIADLLGRTRWDTIVVLDDLEGQTLRFDTIYGDLIPMFDHYAARTGARAAITRAISNPELWSWPGMEAFRGSRATVLRATGEAGDLRADVAAILGYIAGRDAYGAPELRR